MQAESQIPVKAKKPPHPKVAKEGRSRIGAPKPGPVRTGIRQWIEVSPFILAGMVLVGVFVIYPQIKNLWMSFLDYKIMNPSGSTFVGFENYLDAFIGKNSGDFWLAYRNVILYALVTVPIIMLFGLITAVMVNSVKHFSVFFRAMLYLPVLIDWVIVSIIFLYLFQGAQAGPVNFLLLKLRMISAPIPWLQQTWTAEAVIWIFGIWKNIGWAMLIYLAGLQGIDKQIYEAASIDGAGAAQKFWKITVPLIRPTTLYVLINLVIGSFNIFFAVYLLTQGRPLGTTDVLQNYMYNQAFQFMHFGYACAISVVTGISIFILTLFRNKTLKYERK